MRTLIDSSVLSNTARGRLLVLSAAVLWSSSGAFVKNLDVPDATIAMYRAITAGMVLLTICIISRKPLTWQPQIGWMILCFTLMNYFFIASMTRTTAANTIFLQYTAPFWMFLASVLLLKETSVPGNRWALFGAMIGIAILIAGEWRSGASQQLGIVLGLGSGVTYAGVAIFLRVLRGHDPLWLAALNHLSAGVLLAIGMAVAVGCGSLPVDVLWPPPSPRTLAVLTVFGVIQMAVPYVLFGMGLRHISPQEAGLLTLVEPMLNPLWTYQFADEAPSANTIVGGSILFAMLACRYVPLRWRSQPSKNA